VTLVSVVLSFRNEEEVIPELIARLQAALRGASLDYELIFVNDASTDASRAVLEEQRKADPRVKIVNMSRRFGVAPCVIAGMRYARGEAVVYMDADLQDPPELIPELVAHWQEGADVVYTVRTSRRGETLGKKLVTRAAYWLINAASEIPMPIEAGDFKLLSRRAVDHLLALEEQDLYMRGLVTWLGFRQVAVPYERQARGAGVTHFPLLRSAGPAYALGAAITSLSHRPLFVFLILGILSAGASLLAIPTVLVLRAAGAEIPAGSLILAVAALMWSILVLGIGTLGLYLARVHRDVRRRPRYLVESAHGFDA
jgi:dolichol-phosphate mannosyltransferase